jgi:SAM-dependent methyltransferase
VDYRRTVYDRYVESMEPGLLVEDEALLARGSYIRRLIRQHFPSDRGSRILDVGCGYGPIVHYAQEAGYSRATGVDRSASQVALAGRLGISGVAQGDLIETLASTGANTLDVVVAWNVLEHLTKDETVRLLEGAVRVLVPAGRLIVHVPNASSPFFGSVRYGDFTHEQAFTRTSTTQILLACGFGRVECFEELPVVHGARSALRHFLWRAIRLALVAYDRIETGVSPGIYTRDLVAVAYEPGSTGDFREVEAAPTVALPEPFPDPPLVAGPASIRSCQPAPP